jgi:hypothetical protein
MLRGQAKVDPGQGFSGSDSQDKSKPETEPKNGNHFGIRRCSFIAHLGAVGTKQQQK